MTILTNMSTVYLGLGSNLGDKLKNCENAISAIGLTRGIKVTGRSSFYQTRPVGGPVQDDFINGVIQLKTEIGPEECLAIFKNIEKSMGRETSVLNGPRIIDIDILLFDDLAIETNSLAIPHPRLHERYFVLRGLSELAPDLVHPVLGKTVLDMYREAKEAAKIG